MSIGRSSGLRVEMLRILFLLAMLWGATEGRLTVKGCGYRNDVMGRIVGGRETTHGYYPWMVTIHEYNYGYYHVCGGSIINEYWIVTAAHCIVYPKEPSWYVVYVGLHELSKKTHERAKHHRMQLLAYEGNDLASNCSSVLGIVLTNMKSVGPVLFTCFLTEDGKDAYLRIRCIAGRRVISNLAGCPLCFEIDVKTISKVIVHEHYDNRTFQHDIALLRTKVPIDIKGSDGYVNGVCLPDTKTDPRGWAIVTGWGHTVEEGENSDILKAVRVPIIPRGRCNKAYDEDPYDDEDEVLDTMICAGTFGKDSCQNDSGGPMVQRNRKNAFTLIGIVSYGTGCGGPDHPGVYTKVASYVKWMAKNMDK